jgi:chromosome partitioning protein
VLAEIVAVANHKGGVGKSFTAVSLASGMAHAGWRTLLVDCDAQANATSMFDPDDQVEFDLLDIIVRGVEAAKAVLTTRVAGLDLLGATLDVARLDQELITRHYREEQVRRALAPLLDDYDVMVLDLSPNLGQLVITALNAATGLIVPTDATKWGRRGVTMFLDWAEELRRADVLSAELLGIVLTKYESRTQISREVLDDLRRSDWPVFNTLIPKRIAAERMVANMQVVGDPEADHDLSEAYANLTAEVLERMVASVARRGRHSRG